MQVFYEGVVKWYSEDKGYGFITHHGPQNQKDFFVHATGVLDDGGPPLKKGEPVEFMISESKRGPRAINVRRKPVEGVVI